MMVILNSSTILEGVKDLQVSSDKGGLLLCAESVKKANEFEDTLKKFNIKYQRFGQGAQFEIDCWAISAYDNINK